MKTSILFVISFFILNLIVIGCSSNSENPAPEPDTVAPLVNFEIDGITDSSSSGTVVLSNEIKVNINAEDAGGITKVEAFIDDVKVGEDSSEPYQITIDISGYESKNLQIGKFKDYTLKIVVTDNSGNTTTEEQIINIDNELPNVSEVSLEPNSIINGDTNIVSFNISDNEGIKEVKTLINDELISEITDTNYQVNINTLNLSDGENSLKIEATDLADNIAVFEVVFISDNTGPEISFSNLVNNQILDQQLTISPEVQDEYSEVTSFTFKINEDIFLETSSVPIEDFILNPEDIAVGIAQIEIEALDALGNRTILSLNNQVLRKLFVANFENGFIENDWIKFHILISEMNGSIITLKSVAANSPNTTIYAPDEFPMDKEYMVSFISEEDTNSWIPTNITVVQNLTRENFTEIKFSPPFGKNVSQHSIPLLGFDGIENILGAGHGFMGSFNSDVTQFELELNNGYGYGNYSDLYLIGYALGDEPEDYGYLKIKHPQGLNYAINKSDFVFDNIVAGTSTYSGNTTPINSESLFIWGYENSLDIENNLSHLIHDSNYTFGPVGVVSYRYPTIFETYRHHLRLNNYNTYRNGLPAPEYTIPNWGIDHIQNGNEISLTKSGVGHITGRLIVHMGSSNASQLMTMIFDSSKQSTLYIPQLPEELSSLNIYSNFQNQTYSVDYSELISFDTISSYSEYLNQVISKYKEHTEVSPVMESITNTNAHIFNNWGFKY